MAERVNVAGPAPRQDLPPTPSGRRPPRAGHGGLLDLQRRAGNLATAGLVTQLQRAGLPTEAGNRAVAASLAQPPDSVMDRTQGDSVTVQASGENSGEGAVDKALRTKDPGDVKAIDKKEISGLPVEKKMDLVRILAYQGWVGPFDEGKIEEIWGTLTTEELVRTGSREIVMFNHCITVGADLYRLPNVKLMAGDFRLRRALDRAGLPQTKRRAGQVGDGGPGHPGESGRGGRAAHRGAVAETGGHPARRRLRGRSPEADGGRT
jgi:hypothetical protein